MKQSTIMQILFTGDDVVVACFQRFLTKKRYRKGNVYAKRIHFVVVFESDTHTAILTHRRSLPMYKKKRFLIIFLIHLIKFKFSLGPFLSYYIRIYYERETDDNVNDKNSHQRIRRRRVFNDNKQDCTLTIYGDNARHGG